MRTARTSVALTLILSGTAMAGWPTDPASPLFVGPLNNAFDERAGLRSGADGSVWLAWQQAYCVGDVLLQHIDLDGNLLAPMAMPIQDDLTCGFHLEPAMAVFGESIVVSRKRSSLLDTPVQRYSQQGTTLWSPAFTADDVLVLETLATLDNGDTLIISQGWDTIHVDRIDPQGNQVWAKQLSFPVPGGANFDVVSFVPDDAGGGYVFWEDPAGYVRSMHAMRISSSGQAAWAATVPIVSVQLPQRGTSRHTHSEMVSDGHGGAIIVYTEGFEQGTSPAAMYMQRILPDGSLAFPMPGIHVSTDFDRQFDVDLERDPATNDLLITWLHGFFNGVEVRAQRMTIDGDRLWGDEGVEIRPFSLTGTSFDSVWSDGKLKTAIGVPAEVTMIQTSAEGVVDPVQVLVGNAGPASFVKAASSNDGVVIVWQVDGPQLEDKLVAQRVNRHGQLGGDNLCPADLTGDQSLDFFDVSAFLNAFNAMNPIADFTGDGSFDFFDVSAFLNAFNAGCP
ncbi:MAG: GC-type dockerin domain-anchored protein [Phycisphaerales bacterium]